MFDLEQSIAEWRKQMLAAGIKPPTPLEELECHLREDIERQVKAGGSEQQAFESSASQIGQAEALKKEFKKVKGLRGRLGDDQTTKIHCLLGMLWLAICSWGILAMLGVFFTLFQYIEGSRMTPAFIIALLLVGCICMCGIGGSISLYRGKNQGRRIIRLIATLCVIAFLAQHAVFRSGSVSGLVFDGIFTLFSLATIWLLQPPQKSKLATQ